MTLKGSNYSKLFFLLGVDWLMLLTFGVDIDLNTCGNQNPLRWVEITRLLACDDVWYLVTKHWELKVEFAMQQMLTFW